MNSAKAKSIFGCLAILMLLFALRLAMLGTLRLHFSYDSFEYFDFSVKEYLSPPPRGVDWTRMPFYGSILRLVLKAKNGWLILVMVQLLGSLFGTVALEESMFLVCGRREISVLFSVAYALNPSIWMWDYAVLTESMALTGTCFMIYLFLSFLKSPSICKVAMLSILCFFLTFLRPSSLIFLLIFCGFLLFLTGARLTFSSKRHIFEVLKYHVSLKRHLVFLAIGMIPLLLVVIHCVCFYEKFGIFTLSGTMVRQQVYNDIAYELYKNNPDAEVRILLENELKKGTSTWNTMIALFQFPIERVEAFHRNCVMLNFAQFIKSLLQQVQNNLFDHFAVRHTELSDISYYGTQMAINRFGIDGAIIPEMAGADIITKIDTIVFQIANFFAVIMASLISLVQAAICFYKKQNYIIDFGIFVFIAGILLTTFVGQCAEFGRTAICTLPFFYLFLSKMIAQILKKGAHKNDSLFGCHALPAVGQHAD